MLCTNIHTHLSCCSEVPVTVILHTHIANSRTALTARMGKKKKNADDKEPYQNHCFTMMIQLPSHTVSHDTENLSFYRIHNRSRTKLLLLFIIVIIIIINIFHLLLLLLLFTSYTQRNSHKPSACIPIICKNHVPEQKYTNSKPKNKLSPHSHVCVIVFVFTKNKKK